MRGKEGLMALIEVMRDPAEPSHDLDGRGVELWPYLRPLSSHTVDVIALSELTCILSQR